MLQCEKSGSFIKIIPTVICTVSYQEHDSAKKHLEWTSGESEDRSIRQIKAPTSL